jgi:hypothetical protein
VFFKTETKYSIYKEKTVVLNSVIKCPECGFENEELMFLNSCRFYMNVKTAKNIKAFI